MSEKPSGDIILYPSGNGEPTIEVRLDGDTVWLSQDQMAALFGKAKSTINEHIKNIFAEPLPINSGPPDGTTSHEPGTFSKSRYAHGARHIRFAPSHIQNRPMSRSCQST